LAPKLEAELGIPIGSFANGLDYAYLRRYSASGNGCALSRQATQPKRRTNAAISKLLNFGRKKEDVAVTELSMLNIHLFFSVLCLILLSPS